MPLTDKQSAFVSHYLASWNATQAAIRAGYSAKTARSIGAENLTKPDIKAEIEARIAAIIPRGERIERLAAIARASIADVVRLPQPQTREDGSTYVVGNDWDLDLVKAVETGAIHHIKKLKAGKYGTDVEMYSKLEALALLLKVDTPTDDGILKYIDLATLTPDQLQRIADGENPIHVLRRAE